MRIKLDENLPEELAAALRSRGHDVHTVFQEQLSGQPDPTVWDAARREKRFLVTQDLDFSDIRRYQPGTHAGVLLVRLRSPSRSRLAARVADVFLTHPPESLEGAFVVASDTKVRVRRPAFP